jgi:hypothetical protein
MSIEAAYGRKCCIGGAFIDLIYRCSLSSWLLQREDRSAAVGRVGQVLNAPDVHSIPAPQLSVYLGIDRGAVKDYEAFLRVRRITLRARVRLPLQEMTWTMQCMSTLPTC